MAPSRGASVPSGMLRQNEPLTEPRGRSGSAPRSNATTVVGAMSHQPRLPQADRARRSSVGSRAAGSYRERDREGRDGVSAERGSRTRPRCRARSTGGPPPSLRWGRRAAKQARRDGRLVNDCRSRTRPARVPHAVPHASRTSRTRPARPSPHTFPHGFPHGFPHAFRHAFSHGFPAPGRRRPHRSRRVRSPSASSSRRRCRPTARRSFDHGCRRRFDRLQGLNGRKLAPVPAPGRCPSPWTTSSRKALPLPTLVAEGQIRRAHTCIGDADPAARRIRHHEGSFCQGAETPGRLTLRLAVATG